MAAQPAAACNTHPAYHHGICQTCIQAEAAEKEKEKEITKLHKALSEADEMLASRDAQLAALKVPTLL